MRSSMPPFSNLVHFEAQLAQIPTLTNWMSHVESHITNTLEGIAAGLMEMAQKISVLTARMCRNEADTRTK